MNQAPKYFELNGTTVGMVPKSGSSAIARAIKLHLEPNWKIVTTSGEDVPMTDAAWSKPGWQASVPKTESPNSPIIPVRDPVERFRSACAQEVKTADEALAILESGNNLSGHFRRTSDWLVDGCRLCKFPDHIGYIASELGLAEIPPVNESTTNNGPKPDLTAEQQARVEAYYSDDIALFNSITEAGQAYTKPVPPPVVNPYQAAYDAAAAAFDALPVGKQRIWEGLGIRQAIADAILRGDIAGAIEIINTIPPIYPDAETDRQAFLSLFQG